MKRLMLIMTFLGLALSATAQEGWIMEATSRKDYNGATMANGRIGVVTDDVPFSAREIVLAGVFDKEGYNGVSRVARGPVFLNMELTVDGKKVSDKDFSGWNQVFDIRKAQLTTNVELKGKASFKYTVLALRHLPYNAMSIVEVVPHKDITLKVENIYGIPEEMSDVQSSFGEGAQLVYQLNAATRTKMHRVSSSSMFMFDGEEPEVKRIEAEGRDGMWFSAKLKKGQTYRFALVGAVCSTQDFKDPVNESKRFATFAYKSSIDYLLEKHRAAWEELWQGDVIIEGDPESQLDIRHALYQLYSITRDNCPVGIAPMGLSSSEGYNGHYFWDTELWMYPPILVMNPAAGRSLMDYRAGCLPQAMQNAQNHGYRGAQYPWEADTSGEECTPVWALTGTYEHHITADVGIAMWQYYCVTGDKEWLEETAWPVLKAVAEFWVSRVQKNQDGSYSIINVVGADEYAENVDDNAFTNGAAKRVLQDVAAAAEVLGKKVDPMWKEVADNLVFTYNTERVTMEYTGYNGQLIKQTDVNMLAYPLGVITDRDHILRDIEYYFDRIDPNGPAMSNAIIAVLYARLGDPDMAFKVFKKSYTDKLRPPFGVLSENANNSRVSFATGLGGILQSVIFGFAGVEITEEGIIQLPTKLPSHWKSLTVTGAGPQKQDFRVENPEYNPNK
ncbi:MAG: glycoside hydrolase family 65 protein [Bacteroidales bacterium]|nr:glycoside hydrolase family 65 protein [Bacteroidales bacterium]